MQTHRLFYLILVVATLAITSAQVGAYYYVERSNNGVTSGSSALCNYLTTGSSGASEIVVNTLINYGNGTIKWYNQTTVPSSWNAYALTMYVTKCDVQTRYMDPRWTNISLQESTESTNTAVYPGASGHSAQ